MSSSAFVSLFVSRITQKLNRFSQNSAEREPRKKPSDFGGNPDNVTIEFSSKLKFHGLIILLKGRKGCSVVTVSAA